MSNWEPKHPDVSVQLTGEDGYNELKLGLLRALRSRDAAAIQAYLNSIGEEEA